MSTSTASVGFHTLLGPPKFHTTAHHRESVHILTSLATIWLNSLPSSDARLHFLDAQVKRGGAAVAPSGGEQLSVMLEDESCRDPWGSGGSFGGILVHREGRQRNKQMILLSSSKTSSFPPMSGVPEVTFAAEAEEAPRWPSSRGGWDLHQGPSGSECCRSVLVNWTSWTAICPWQTRWRFPFFKEGERRVWFQIQGANTPKPPFWDLFRRFVDLNSVPQHQSRLEGWWTPLWF